MQLSLLSLQKSLAFLAVIAHTSEVTCIYPPVFQKSFTFFNRTRAYCRRCSHFSIVFIVGPRIYQNSLAIANGRFLSFFQKSFTFLRGVRCIHLVSPVFSTVGTRVTQKSLAFPVVPTLVIRKSLVFVNDTHISL